jgi:hypothetical protein
MIVNTHLEGGGTEATVWVRVRDASLKIYDMSPEEIETDESVCVATRGDLS